MSKAALESIMKGVLRYSQLKNTLRGVTTPGSIYRKASLVAPHRVELTKKAIEAQLTAMITDTKGLNLQTVKAPTLKILVDIVYENIKKALLAEGFEWSESSHSFYIQSEEDETEQRNIFRKIGAAFNQAFGGDKAYGPFFDFLINNLTDKNDVAHVVTFKNNLGTSKQALQGYGFDVGHIEANVSAAFKAVVWNSLKEDFEHKKNKNKNLDFRNKAAVTKELDRVIEEWNKLIQDPVAGNVLYDYLIREKIVTDAVSAKATVEGFFEHTLEFARDVSSGVAVAQLKYEPKLKDEDSMSKIARQVVVSIIPEYGRGNQAKGSTLEKNILYQLEVIGASSVKSSQNRLSKVMEQWIAGELKVSGLPVLIDVEGSRTFRESMGIALHQLLSTGKTTPQKIRSKASIPKTASVRKAKPAQFKDPRPLNIPRPVAPPLRGRSGRFQSLVNIVNMVNMKLAEKIRQNMGSPRLNWRTGRFAESAKVLTASRDSDGLVRMPYTYMKTPYQTFEPGYAQGSRARNPKVVISESIRQLATRLVTSNLRVVRI